MASKTSLLSAIANRRTIYDLTATSPIPDSRIIDIVQHITLHVPSPFNSQSARFLILLREEHQRLWDQARSIMSQVLPETVFTTYFAPMIAKYRGGYGTILCFEDQATVAALAKQYDGIIPQDKFQQWSEHSAGMHQFALWCALEAEELGANLQHYNPNIDGMVRQTWSVSPDWALKAQLVFGTPADDARNNLKEKEVKPLEERVLVKGT
ncbi:uncharacterized protein Z518_08437 [Rhinocladiella mackenziei CBS 650.93]|uniref:Nitroreductase domain-containing protein n=1 Tax=Rhinocladiella mackenziei CBS 650.93 TaxID=1442369 RepID=A0A0D2IGU8_9EURO|nr:uncharacterized protein Z518_08437 [Rhinocladiella mackenziei CBS 650.93]KIX02496.1 hypothetical protein Z518_08437 [Rhinocladiella mackenziei CBS 650.93]